MTTEFDVKNALSFLKQAGFDLDKLPEEKLERLNRIGEKIQDPRDVSPEITREIMEIMGIKVGSDGVPKRMPKKSEKVGRNEKCPCLSGKKYKFCCGN